MPVKGMITKSGILLPREEALEKAAKDGHVDGWPLAILTLMLPAGVHSDRPSASVIAGGSWRQAVLTHILDYYIRPEDRMGMTRGTLIHGGLEKVILPGSKSEKYLRVLIPNKADKPKLLTGTIDRIDTGDGGKVIDYKTTSHIPDAMYDTHLYQLAIYAWMARWSGYSVNDVAIVYISWNEARYVDICQTVDGKYIKAINHPLLQDEELFIEWVTYAWNVLANGFEHNFVPGRTECNTQWCQNCPVKWACDRIADEGGVINPSEFIPEDYQ